MAVVATLEEVKAMEVRAVDEPTFTRWFKGKVGVYWSRYKGRHLVCDKAVDGGESIVVVPPFLCAVHESVKRFVCQCCFIDQPPEPSADGDGAGDGEPTHRDHAYPCTACRQTWYCSKECMRKDAKIHDGVECRALARLNDQEYDADIMTEVRSLLRVIGRSTRPPRADMLTLARHASPDEEARRAPWRLPPPRSLTRQFNGEALYFWQLISNSDKLDALGTLDGLRGIVEYTVRLLDESARLSIDDALEYYCKIRCNMFGVGGTENDILIGYGVYVEGSFFNHSCAPNVGLSREYRELDHNFFALRDIPAGTELNITYIDDLTQDTAARRKHLLENYFFHCVCDRCETDGPLPDYICMKNDCKGFLVPKPDEKKRKNTKNADAVPRQCNVCYQWE